MRIFILFLVSSITVAQAQSTAKRLTNVSDSYPVASPDGQYIAFQSNRTGNWEIYTMRVDGSGIRQLTFNDAPDNGPAWSPDSKKIVFVSERHPKEFDSEVYIMNADGSNQKRLTNQIGDDSHPKFSPDGKRIIFNSARSTPDLKAEWSKQWIELFTMDTAGNDVQQLTRFKTVSTFPSISPDGKKIVYRKVTNAPAFNWDLSANKNNRNSEIFVMDFDGGKDTNISNNAAFDGWPAWSPDGKLVVYASNRMGPANVGQLFICTADGKDLRQVSSGAGSFVQPGISADNKHVFAYQAFEGEDYEYGNLIQFEIK